MNKKGFTLVELLVVVSLIIIIAGVTGDIVITLVRSYSKTQITNEIEQNANFVLNKLEKELRKASNVTNVSGTNILFTQTLSDGSSRVIEYKVVDASDEYGAEDGVYTIARAVDGGAYVPLTNYQSPSGVNVDQDQPIFEEIGSGSSSDVVKAILTLEQIGSKDSLAPQFTQSTTLEKVVVVRGSY